MGMIRKFICVVAAFVLLLPFSAFAQSGRTVTVVLQDALTSEPVAYATVSLTKKDAKNVYRYSLSSSEGKAVIEKVASGSYTIKAELMGYKLYTKEITVGQGSLDLGIVKMEQDKEVLDAARVSAVGNPIIMKKDTIEYNASSFKTTDNDMLEDLLKKLPGVEVEEDGTLTANGETISKITIDGKTFFLDDPQLASKNLPAKIIEKVKVVQKKSEQAEFTGIDDGEEETIIDLNVRKGMMNGLMGNFAGGLGHDMPEQQSGSTLATDNGDLRYQGSGFVGRFGESNNLSLILNANNTNNRGFTDMAGGMMGGMRGGMGRGGGRGVTTSWMVGANAAADLFDDRMELGGNYVYNGSNNSVEEKSSRTTYLDNRNIVYDSEGFSNTDTYGQRLGMRLEHKFSDNTSIFFTPQVNFGGGNFHEFSKTSTNTEYADGVLEKTNDGFTSNIGDNKNWTTSGRLLLRQRLGLPGRTVTLNVNYNFSNNEMEGLNQSLTSTYLDGAQQDSVINQRFDQFQRRSSIGGTLTYTEPLGNGFYVEANYRIGYNRNTSEKRTYDSGPNDGFSLGNMEYVGVGEKYNDVYSSQILNRYINQNIGGNFLYQKEKIRAQIGFGASPTNTHNETNGQVYDSKKVNWAPRAMLRYEMGDFSNLRLNYRGSSSQPSTSQLMAVPDNTNPLNVSFGNPYLTPYFSHNVTGEYRYSNRETFTSFNSNFRIGTVQDPIVNATWYGENGAQYSMPVNGHNSLNGNLRLNINSPIAKSNFSFFIMSNTSFSKSSSYVGSTFNVDPYYKDGEFDYEMFHKDYPNLDEVSAFTLNNLRTFSNTERIRLTYRTDNLEVTLGGRTRMSKSWYTVSSSSTDMTFNNMVDASFNWTMPAGFEIKTDARYNWYNGYQTQQEPEFVLNAQLSKLLFKNRVTMTVKAYDILNQAKTLTVSDSGNYHMESLNNTLGRYIIASLTYRFGTFGGNRGGFRGPGPGGHGGGRGPGRPPMR